MRLFIYSDNCFSHYEHPWNYRILATMQILLINPPVSKPSEPPAGLARLHGALSHYGIHSTLLDANLEGLQHLMHLPCTASDTWTRRALRNREGSRAALTNIQTYCAIGRYTRAVKDISRVLEMTTKAWGVQVGLADYQDNKLSPVRSPDLLFAAEHPEQNPFYPYFKERLLKLLDDIQPNLIGFSVNFLSQALTAFAMIGFIRHCSNRIKIILGGGLITSWMRRGDFKNPFSGIVDELIAGPGESHLLSLAGIAAREEVFYTPDYNQLPFDQYFAPGRILPYSASSGCYWNKCAFCPEKAEGNPYLPVSGDQAILDLTTLSQNYKPVLIHLLDNALSPVHLKKIVEHPPGIPWYGFARITPHLQDADFCRALRQAGCVMLQLGLESGDDDVLGYMYKGITTEDASKTLHNLKQAGIAAYVYLLFGTPRESAAAARRTFDFIVKHHEQIDFLNVALFNMPVAGNQGDQMETKPFYEADLSLYADFVHPRGWDRKSVRQFLDKEFKRHPAIAGILKRDPPFFTSNHAAFFTPPHSAEIGSHLKY